MACNVYCGSAKTTEENPIVEKIMRLTTFFIKDPSVLLVESPKNTREVSSCRL